MKERHVHIRSPFLCRRFFVSICCDADAMRDAWRDGDPGFINGVGSSVGTCLHSTQSGGQMRAEIRGRGLQRSHLLGISASFRGKTRLGRCLRFVRRAGAGRRGTFRSAPGGGCSRQDRRGRLRFVAVPDGAEARVQTVAAGGGMQAARIRTISDQSKPWRRGRHGRGCQAGADDRARGCGRSEDRLAFRH